MIFFLTGCATEPGVDLSVALVTDYQPVRDFLSVSVTVGGNSATKNARLDAGYVVPGERLHTFEDLAPKARREVTLTLHGIDEVVAETTMLIEHKEHTVLTISASRRCKDGCPPIDGEPQRCVGGACVSAACLEGAAQAMLGDVCPANCNTSADCSTTSSCAQPVCVLGSCFECDNDMCYEANWTEKCTSGLVCDVDQGCVPAIDDDNSCEADSDCEIVGGCFTPTCVVGLCVYDFAEDGTSCDSGQGVCVSGGCQPLECYDAAKNGLETDVDCGGTECAGCELGQSCLQTSDCAVGLCDTKNSFECEPINTCGNGTRETGERCDDGNTVDADACSNRCRRGLGVACTNNAQCESNVCDLLESNTCEMANVCGNGAVEGSEACDDGATVGGDGCSAGCKRENGQPCTSDSQCQSGVCDLLGSNTCEPANTCGNGKREGSEICDDGNTSNGDTCSSACKLANNQPCTSDTQCQSTVCDTVGQNRCEAANVCGNGKVEGTETCDDGDTVGAANCTEICLIPKPGFVLTRLDERCSNACQRIGYSGCGTPVYAYVLPDCAEYLPPQYYPNCTPDVETTLDVPGSNCVEFQQLCSSHSAAVRYCCRCE